MRMMGEPALRGPMYDTPRGFRPSRGAKHKIDRDDTLQGIVMGVWGSIGDLRCRCSEANIEQIVIRLYYC